MENKIRNAFDNIKADSSLKETTKEFLSQKREEKEKPFYGMRVYKTFTAVCGILLLTIGLGSFWCIGMPVSYVSIDVNPSVELALNRFDRVVSAEAYNPEGEEILENLSLEGKKYIEAIDAVVESKVMERYLTRQAEIVFTIAADVNREQEIKTGVSHCQGHIRHKSHSLGTDLKTAVQAHNQGLSVGKYYAYLQLSQYDSTVTMEECRHMSVGEIHGLVHNHEQNGGNCQEKEHESLEQGCEDEAGSSFSHDSHHEEGHHSN